MGVFIAVLWLLGAGVTLAETHRWGFDEDPVGKAPDAFTAARTGQGAEGTWIVEAAADAASGPNAVKQTSRDTS